MAKSIDLAADLIPIGRFKSQAATLLKSLEQEGRTLVITQNGTAAAVVMSPRDFDQLRYRQRFVEEVASGLADADAGRVLTSAKVKRMLAARRSKNK